MPFLVSSYQAPRYLRGGHVSTVGLALFRRVPDVKYQRERLELADGDFLDLDWMPAAPSTESRKLVVLTHGLLGDSRRSYIQAAAWAFNRVGWDVLAWNMRGMSGTANRLERMTTHGGSDDLAEVMNWVLRSGNYPQISLVGFSKGGNIALKYAGELGDQLPKAIKSIVAISVPCDVAGSAAAMGVRSVYANRFKRKLVDFLAQKKALISPAEYQKFSQYRTLEDFTNHYIAPVHGFRDADDYYEKCSSLPWLDRIRVPSLILNAQNDPVLSESCSPLSLARQSNVLFLETPLHGGHCGFYEKSSDGQYWMERRALEFASEYLIENRVSTGNDLLK